MLTLLPLFRLTLQKCVRKQSRTLRDSTKRRLWVVLLCFQCRDSLSEDSGSLGILQRCDHKLAVLTKSDFKTNCVLNSESLARNIFVVRAGHVSSVLQSGQHVLQSSCECRSTRTGHIRTQACGLSRHSLAHGNTRPL